MMINLLQSRRSIRRYTTKPITKTTLDQLLSSALLSPSSMNKKTVEFIIIDDKETLSALEKCKKHGTIALKTAPLAIAIIADTNLSDVWVEDASITAILLQLEAEKLGLGSCWIQMRNRQSETGDSESDVRKVLNIPEHYGVLAVLTFGFKDEVKEGYDLPDLESNKIHYDKF